MCSFLLSLNKFLSSLSSVLMKEIVLLKSWGGAVGGEVKLPCLAIKGEHAEMLVGVETG